MTGQKAIDPHLNDACQCFNYRLVKSIDSDSQLQLHEVYYNPDGKPRGSTDVAAVWKNEVEVMTYLEALQSAMRKPVLRKEEMYSFHSTFTEL